MAESYINLITTCTFLRHLRSIRSYSISQQRLLYLFLWHNSWTVIKLTQLCLIFFSPRVSYYLQKSYSIECCSYKLLCMSICCHTVWNRVVTIFTNINANNIHVRKLRLENDDALMRLLYILKWKVHIFPYLKKEDSLSKPLTFFYFIIIIPWRKGLKRCVIFVLAIRHVQYFIQMWGNSWNIMKAS